MKLDAGLYDYDLRELPEHARKLESIGYDCLWTSETQHDPFLPLAVAAGATSSIKLGTSIALAFTRSPMVVAYTSWDIQKASAGRFILGLGSQVKAHNQRRFSVKFDSPGPKLREIVLALRAIWDCWQNGTPLNFQGEFYKFDLMTPFFNPGPIAHPKIPIFIAAVNPYMCRIAGEVCDGIHVHPFHTPKYLRDHIHPSVERGLRASSRARQGFSFATASFVIVGDTEREREQNTEAVRQQIAFYASTPSYEAVLAVQGWEAIMPELNRKIRDGNWNGMARLITDEMLDEITVTGTYESIGRKLRERYAGLLDRIALYQPYKTTVEDSRMVTLAKEVSNG